ncbi:MAG: ABC transporter permease [Lachnospiraceae bacterium]|nr:ABC transporter permease [Lachnospiraceae bacterium]
MKELARYKIHAVVLILGFCIASVMFSYSFGIMVNKEAEQKDIEACQYQYTACFYASPTENANVCPERDALTQDMLTLLDGIKETGDIVVHTSFINVNLGVYGVCTANIYFDGQMPKYRLVKGDFPTEEQLQSDGRYVVLGINKKDATYRRDGRDYILIQEDEYEVTGYISAKNSTILDNKILLFYSSIGDRIKQNLLDYYRMAMLNIIYESDTNSETYTYMSDYIHSLDAYEEEYGTYESSNYNIMVSDSGEQWYSTAEPLPMYGTWSKLIYLFCIVMLLYVMELWMQQRREEFAIRKAFGYSDAKIMGLIMAQMAKLLLVAVVMSELIISLLTYADVGIYVLNTKDIFDRVVRELIFAILTFLFVSIIPFIRICTEKPMVLLCRGKAG